MGTSDLQAVECEYFEGNNEFYVTTYTKLH